jgi:hypothetical protein
LPTTTTSCYGAKYGYGEQTQRILGYLNNGQYGRMEDALTDALFADLRGNVDQRLPRNWFWLPSASEFLHPVDTSAEVDTETLDELFADAWGATEASFKEIEARVAEDYTVTLQKSNSDALLIGFGAKEDMQAWQLDGDVAKLGTHFAQDAAGWLAEQWDPWDSPGWVRVSTVGLVPVATWHPTSGHVTFPDIAHPEDIGGVQHLYLGPDRPIAFNAGLGDTPGFVAGWCEHRVAWSEWRAGYRTCERCTHITTPGRFHSGQ